jgi:type IV fimbrial biogenesis protein FimT
MLNPHSQSGVTLIELIIGIVIVGITLALAVPGYATWIQNSRLRNGAESILAGLQLARAEAVRRNTNVRFTLGAGTAWTISCNVVTATCPANIQSHTAGDGSSAAVTVTMVAGGANPLIFSNLGRLTTAATSFNIDNNLLSAANSRDLRVVAEAGGTTRLCDPNVAVGDSRAC